ncbi:MAG: type I-MYXAN CRISPR-associated protein Cas6/Cmx6 [Deltaproteobacteria bacterium]|nr:type I-MYXAN CRISPR-associated protein Cas6/Cmx6 [Deltaproteobacteria bacterium]
MTTNQYVDVGFPAVGPSLPIDHGYLLFSALCCHLPQLRHEPDWGVHPVPGRRVGPTRLALFQHSLVQLRVPTHSLSDVMVLGGKSIHVGSHLLRLGMPSVYRLHPAQRVRSHCVTVHGHEQADRFADALRHELSRLPATQPPAQIEVIIGARTHVRTRAHVVPGFEVILGDLQPETSRSIQAHGIGGRRYLGLGLFVPCQPGRPTTGAQPLTTT